MCPVAARNPLNGSAKVGADSERSRGRTVLFPRLPSFLLILSLSYAPSAFPQQATAAEPAETRGQARAVVQLLAIGPGGGDKNRECSATGFLVSPEGYILTNAHVMEEAQRCLGRNPHARILAKLAASESRTAKAISCDLVGLDELHDLAVLRTERPPTPAGQPVAYALLEPREVEEGTPVVVIGHPVFAWQPITQAGKVVRRATMGLSDRNTTKSDVLILDISLRPGNSGSPVYDAGGHGVVGVVVSQDPSLPSHTVAVTIRDAIDLLDRYGVNWHAAGKR
jgi:serine protease Do